MQKILGLSSRQFSTTARRLGAYPYKLTFISNSEVNRGSARQVALKFSDKAPTNDQTVVGWVKSKDEEIKPAGFVENAEFNKVVNQVIAKYAHEDPILQALAKYQKSGWLHVTDDRNPPPLGRIPDAEDIFGSILVENEMIKPHSFQENWAHRPVTRDGLFQLPQFLHQKLIEHIEGNEE